MGQCARLEVEENKRERQRDWIMKVLDYGCRREFWLIAWFREDRLGIRGGFFFDRQQTDSKGVATEYPSILLLTAC